MLKAKRTHAHDKGPCRYIFDSDELQALIPAEVLAGRTQGIFDWLHEWFRDEVGEYLPGTMFAERFGTIGFMSAAYLLPSCTCTHTPSSTLQERRAACNCEPPETLTFRPMTAQEREKRDSEVREAWRALA